MGKRCHIIIMHCSSNPSRQVVVGCHYTEQSLASPVLCSHLYALEDCNDVELEAGDLTYAGTHCTMEWSASQQNEALS